MWYTLTYIYIFLKFLVYDMPTIEKIPHLSLDSLGKEAFLPRPDGGAIEKMGRCFCYNTGLVENRDSHHIALLADSNNVDNAKQRFGN